jgi:protein-S-isoprenylcysteine O-methyltransferase Ste14
MSLARFGIHIAALAGNEKRSARPAAFAFVAIAGLLGAGAVISLLIAASIFFEQTFGHLLAPVAMSLLFLLLAGLALLMAGLNQRQVRKAQLASAAREAQILQTALLLKDHKGLVLLAALAAGLFAGTSK